MFIIFFYNIIGMFIFVVKYIFFFPQDKQQEELRLRLGNHCCLHFHHITRRLHNKEVAEQGSYS